MQGKSLGDAHFRVNADGLVADYYSARDMPGARVAGDVVGRHVSDLLSAETALLVVGAIKECLASDSVVDITYMSESGDGNRLREASLTPIGGGEVLAVVRDITDRQAADDKRTHLAEILEASSDYVATTDVNGRIMYANGAFRRRFGIDNTLDIASESYNLFHYLSPESREKFLNEGVPELWRTGHWSGEIEAMHPDGTTIPLWQAAIAHYNGEGTPEFFSGISRDITEMRRAEAELRISEERFRALVAESSDVILVLSAEGRITYASPAFEKLLGYPEGSMLGSLGFDLIHPDDRDAALVAFGLAFTGDNAPGGLQYRVLHADGSWRWAESHTTNHIGTPGVEGFIVNVRDVTARHEANAKLEQTSDLLTSVMGAAGSEAIMVTDATGTIVAFSRGAETLLGYSADEVLGLHTPKIFHLPAEIGSVTSELGISDDDLFFTSPPGGEGIDREWTLVRRDGSQFNGSLHISGRVDSNGISCGLVAVVRDVTENRRRQAELTQRADFDQLTGLANRAYLQVALAEAADYDSWSIPGRIMLFIDLDHFKQVNDTLGHAAGDAVLAGVAERLRENLRIADLPARIGGDEFVVLLGSNMSPATATEVARRIVVALATPFAIVGTNVTIGASVGMATSNVYHTPDALLHAADTAAYAAKHAGRGRVVEAAH
jgi:diguanylate cyclase (GGDEF)-like protein/PAS domain S-box-containing protein